MGNERGTKNSGADATFPSAGRLIGIDFGQVNIGIAITDAGQAIASPYENYMRCNDALDARHFQQIAEREDVVGIVVGLPVYASGDESEKSRESRAYGQWLQATTGLPVRFFDERYTTRVADSMLHDAGLTRKRRKGRRDKLAAQIMLASYLESNVRTEPPQALE